MLAVADQALWASTNFVLVVVLAHSASSRQFGLLGVGLSSAILLAGLAGSLGGESLSVHLGVLHRSTAPEPAKDGERDAAVRRAATRVLLLAIATPIVVLAIFAAFGSITMVLVMFAISSGAAVFAEGYRSIYYSVQKTRLVPALAWVWIAVQGLILLIAIGSGGGSFLAVCAWGAGAFACSLVAVALTPIWPLFSGSSATESWRRRRYAFEYVATAGPVQLMVFLAGAFTGLAGAGALRALQSLYGPLNILLQGISNAVIPAKAHNPAGVRATAARVSTLAAGSAAIGTLLLLLPGVGVAILGKNWPSSIALTLGYGLGRCAQGVIFGAMLMYRAHDLGWLSSRLRSVSALALLVPFVLVSQYGLVWATWASSLGLAATAVLWWLTPTRTNMSDG